MSESEDKVTASPIQKGFEYEVRLAVSIPLAWAELLKKCAEHHYDWKCRESGECGTVNGLYNTAIGGPLSSSTLAVRWRDLDLVCKVLEQAPHHTEDWALMLTIRGWLKGTMEAIENQRQLCMKLPGSAE